MPKRRIEEAAARRQAAIDSGMETIVGVNKYRLEKEDDVEVRDIDNTAVREAQIRRLSHIRATRDQAAVDAALKALEQAASDPKQNLLELAVTASRARATVGEISDALERVYGRHRAVTSTISGVYEPMYAKKDEFNAVRAEVAAFAEVHGRRPRILVVKMGQDGHDRGAKVVSTAFADMGFDVDVGPLFSTPEEAARMAVENDVHVVGVSSLAAGHKTLIPQLIAALNAEGAGDILVVAGGVIPAQDYDYLTRSGVALIFGPGTNLPAAGSEIVRMLT
jgi:methylmalonyl-CoA mutase